MPITPFEKVWARVVAYSGKSFKTKTGLPFTYEVRGRLLRPSRTDYWISVADVERAYRLVPLSGPGAINDIVRGPSYLWGILHDERISLGEW